VIQKFHQYIYGCKFILITDHLPLTTILGGKKGIASIAAAKMQKWGLLLSAYHYNIEFKPTKSHANADCLSRIPFTYNSAVGNPHDVTLFNVYQIASLPVTEVHLQTATHRDLVLRRYSPTVYTTWLAIRNPRTPEAILDEKK